MDHIYDPGGVRIGEPPLRGGHRQAQGVLPDEGHTVGVPLGNDQVSIWASVTV